MAKKIFYGSDARARLLEGAKQLYDAVKVTMGPQGNNVIIDESFGGPRVTHDGVSVAKAVDLKTDDEETLGQRVGVELIKKAASKMNDVAGDGTTTVTVLTYHILDEALSLIAAKHNPMLLRRGLEKAALQVIAEIESMSEDITGNNDRVAQVASISAGDPEIGKLIAEVMEKIGSDGIVSVEAGQGLELEKEIVEGYSFDRGYVSQYMVSDPARMEAVLEKPAILISDEKISSIQQILPVLQEMTTAGKKDLVIIAEDVEPEALATLILNKLKGTFNAVVVKAPAYGDLRKSTLEDIAVLTGAKVYGQSTGVTYEQVKSAGLGSARKVIVSKDSATIIQGGGAVADVQARVSDLTTQIDLADTDYKRETLRKRRAALDSKVAVIKVGGMTETEINEKKDRVDDAVAAVKAALAQGIVPGGGVTLVNAADTLDDSDYGVAILKNALVQPFKILIENTGQSSEVWLADVRKAQKGYGLDLSKDIETFPPTPLVDLKEAGIIDPTKVAIDAVRNAVSIAGTAFTAGALIANIPEEPKAQPQMGMM